MWIFNSSHLKISQEAKMLKYRWGYPVFNLIILRHASEFSLTPPAFMTYLGTPWLQRFCDALAFSFKLV